MTDRIDQALSVWERLTWPRLLMTAVAALIAITSAYSWEHRDSVVPALIGNSIATIGVAVSIACIAVGLVGNTLLTRMDRKGDALDAYLHQQVESMTSQLNEAAVEREQLRGMMTAAADREEDCQRRLRRAEREIVRLGGDPPVHSSWGDLG